MSLAEPGAMRSLGFALLSLLVVPQLASANRPAPAAPARAARAASAAASPARPPVQRQAKRSAVDRALARGLDEDGIFELVDEVQALQRSEARASASFFDKIVKGT